MTVKSSEINCLKSKAKKNPLLRSKDGITAVLSTCIITCAHAFINTVEKTEQGKDHSMLPGQRAALALSELFSKLPR
jgi:hypothetical protein